MQELDTISDFATYLQEKETLFSTQRAILLHGGEEDLLALYLHNDRASPDADIMVVGDDLWDGIQQKSEFRARKERDRDSYVWDRFVNHYAQDVLCGYLEPGSSPSEAEMIARALARETRFARRLLGKALSEFLDAVAKRQIRSRCLQSLSGVNYVLLAVDFSTPREARVSELGLRCLASIQRFPTQTIVGIATEIPGSAPKPGHSLDFVYLYAEEWTDEDRSRAAQITQEFGYFQTPKQTNP